MVKVFVEWRKIFLRAQKWGNFIFDQLMDYGQEKREKRQRQNYDLQMSAYYCHRRLKLINSTYYL
jgi:hypothetical protein